MAGGSHRRAFGVFGRRRAGERAWSGGDGPTEIKPPRRASRHDRLLASALASRGVSLEIVEATFLVATARRTFRSENSAPLGPIRSLADFIPVLDELLARPVDPGDLTDLDRELASLASPHAA